MKRLIVLLLLIPIFSYSQKVGEKLPQRFYVNMELDSINDIKIYQDIRKDSSTVIYVKNEKVVGIDYIFDYRYAHDNEFGWLGEYDMVGVNLFRDLDGIYYFITNEKDKFYIRVRHASQILIE